MKNKSDISKGNKATITSTEESDTDKANANRPSLMEDDFDPVAFN